MSDDEHILARVAAGDELAVQECLDRFGGLVWSLARRMCPNYADAEDAVQDVFISLWRNAGRYDANIGTEATFVAMIARRRLIDRARRRGRRPGEGVLFTENSGMPEDGSGRVGGDAELREEAVRAEGVLDRLSRDQQSVLRLAIYRGLSHEKIAQSTGMPLGTVKTHIRRGLMRVRDLLGERGGMGVSS